MYRAKPSHDPCLRFLVPCDWIKPPASPILCLLWRDKEFWGITFYQTWSSFTLVQNRIKAFQSTSRRDNILMTCYKIMPSNVRIRRFNIINRIFAFANGTSVGIKTLKFLDRSFRETSMLSDVSIRATSWKTGSCEIIGHMITKVILLSVTEWIDNFDRG